MTLFRKLSCVVVLTLALASCARTVTYDLSTMPQYNQTIVDEQWSLIGILDAEHYKLATIISELVRAKVLPSPISQAYKTHYDSFLFWKAVTKVQLFHGHFDEAAKSSQKAIDGIRRALETLQADVIKYGTGL